MIADALAEYERWLRQPPMHDCAERERALRRLLVRAEAEIVELRRELAEYRKRSCPAG